MTPDDNDIIYSQYTPDFLGIIERIINTVTDSGVGYDSVVAFLSSAWQIYSIIAFLLSALFIYGIIYSYIRLGYWSEVEAKNLENERKKWLEMNGSKKDNRQWSEIQQHIASGSPNDWKLAIIEADIMLGKILHNAGYAGNSIGEQLKSASATTFKTVQDAWDAHKIRNRIAHEGSDFILTQGMAKEAIIKYQRVFREFGEI